MVISDRYRFIFVHIPKSAGTSCARALRQSLPWWERPQWMTRRGSKHRTLREGLALIAQPRRFRMPIARIAPQSYASIAFVRNPWDRMVSVFHSLKRTCESSEMPGSFDEFIRRIEQRDRWVEGLRSLRSQRSYLSDAAGNLIVDFVGRFESLQRDFSVVTKRLGLDARLPHVNESRHEVYTSYYQPWSQAVVAARFQEDVEEFGYAFGEASSALASGEPESRFRSGAAA